MAATYITGYVVNIMNTSTTLISSAGYSYMSGATVYLGANYSTVSGNGFFSIELVDPTISTIVVKYPRYEETEVAITSSAQINVWKNHGYVG